MSSPYVGEIRMFGGSFNPNGWAMCDGSLVPISENETLFNLIGTTYGGDGQSTFALPNLNGRVPIHAGQGPGISNNYQLGESACTESVTLTTNQIPTHNHAFVAVQDIGTVSAPANNFIAQSDTLKMYAQVAPSTPLGNCVTPAGGSQPHDNMMPYLCITYIISLYGIYPNQN